MAKNIKLELNSTGSNLKDPGKAKLGNVFFRKAKWTIKDNEIESFRIEGKDPTSSYYPFSERPNPNHGTELELEVPLFGETGEWDYKIIWKDKGGTERTLDPKIAVNPIAFTELIFLFLTIITCGIFAMLFYRSLRSRNHLKNRILNHK